MKRLEAIRKLIPLGAGLSWLALGAAPVAQKPDKVDFGRDILPLLSDRCFKCHGPDAGSRMAGLRLDTPEGAFADRGGRWAIVPGKPEQSLVLQRINHPDSPMPPRSSGKTLSAEEKELIRRWIADGARYGKLWSFEPLPAKVPLPSVKSAWVRDDLDRFVLDRLKREGLKPNPEAPRWRWLRRVTLDLTGLPPTEEEIDAFEADRSQNAYEKVVERLLASPSFGERMASEWLDAARYSDSYGYQSDLLMPSWPYRDWVVKAFNENLPYDRFLIDQVAGDRLPNPTRDERLATAFNRLHRQSNEGGSIAEEFKTEYAVDRVDTFGTAFLGLTLGCARCHDHKFDPIKQKEYYQLYAYFNSIQEYGLLLSTEIVPTPSLLLPTPEQEKRLAELESQVKEARAKTAAIAGMASFRGKVQTPLRGVLRYSLDEDGEKLPSNPPGSSFGQKLGKVEFVEGFKGKGVRLDGDNGLVFRGLPARERWEPFSWSFWVQDPRAKGPVVLLHRSGGTDVGFCGFDLMLEDGFLTARVMRHWPGNAVAVRTKTPIAKGNWTQIGWTWDGCGQAAGLKLFVNGAPAETTVLADRLWKKINAYGDLNPSGGDWAFGQRFRDAGFKGGILDEVAFADRDLTAFEMDLLFTGRDMTTIPESYSFESALGSPKGEERRIQKELAQFEEGIREISVMEDAPNPIPAYLLARGAYDAPKTEANRVDRGVPASLPPLDPNGPNDRLALAQWATRPDHPLTARVEVNRLWQMLFGAGLVETSENFGMQGARPTHPELLDYLARRFVDSKWDVKKLVGEIVLSATYRQDSARTPSPRFAKLTDPLPQGERDSANRLLSRGPSGRLSAEMVRDTVLAAAGLLNRKVGGPPVNPYQPAGLWQEFNTMSPGFVQSKGADLYRRSLYSTWKRTTPVPSMLMFDANGRESCMTRRPRTNTPLQALVLLNDVQYVEAARVLAERVLKAKPDDEGRLGLAFRLLAGRYPTEGESGVLKKTLEEQRLAFRKDVAGAARLIRVGDSEADPGLRPSELAAFTVAMQTILNSDAVVWKR